MPGPGPRGPRGFTDKKIDMGSVKRLLSMLFSDYPAQMITVVICIIISAIVGVLPSVYIERITAYIEEGLITGWDEAKGKIVKTVIIMIIFFTISIIAITTQGLIMARVTQGFLHKTRTRMFSAMQNLPIKYFDTHGHGDIMSHYTNDVDTLRQLISQGIPQIINSLLTLTALILIMIFYSVDLMVVVIIGIFVMFRVTKTVGGKSARFFMAQQESLGKVECFI